MGNRMDQLRLAGGRLKQTLNDFFYNETPRQNLRDYIAGFRPFCIIGSKEYEPYVLLERSITSQQG